MKQAEMATIIDALIRNDSRTFEEIAKLAHMAPGTVRGFLHKGRNIRVGNLVKLLAVYRRGLKIVQEEH